MDSAGGMWLFLGSSTEGLPEVMLFGLWPRARGPLLIGLGERRRNSKHNGPEMVSPVGRWPWCPLWAQSLVSDSHCEGKLIWNYCEQEISFYCVEPPTCWCVLVTAINATLTLHLVVPSPEAKAGLEHRKESQLSPQQQEGAHLSLLVVWARGSVLL